MAVNDFDYFNRGEYFPFGSGTSSTTPFDYFNRSEYFQAGIATESSSYSYVASGKLVLAWRRHLVDARRIGDCYKYRR